MSLQQKLDEHRATSRAGWAPEVRAAVDRATAEIAASHAGEDAPGVGDRAPDFTLPDQRGREVSLSGLLRRGPVALAFYRGGWWPYCNLQLRAYQSVLAEIEAFAATLVTVSPQLPDNSLTTAEKNELRFPVLSDRGNQVAGRYGLVFRLPEIVRPVYANDFNIDLAAYNGDESFELPVPGTFVIGADGAIRLAFVDADYTRRLGPNELLAALRS